jgi:hypothetical protein
MRDGNPSVVGAGALSKKLSEGRSLHPRVSEGGFVDR